MSNFDYLIPKQGKIYHLQTLEKVANFRRKGLIKEAKYLLKTLMGVLQRKKSPKYRKHLETPYLTSIKVLIELKETKKD